MTVPEEPLLPVEEPRKISLKLWLLAGGAVVALGGVAAILVFRSSPAPANVESVATPRDTASAPGTPKDPSTKKADPRAKPLEAEEKAAQELYSAAEAFDRANPGEPEKVAPKYLEVFHHHPTTTWGRKAEHKARQLQQALEASLERDFQGVRKDAETLAAAGHHVDAVETVQNYLKEQTKETLRRRAEREIVSLQNGSREAFNRAAQQARGLAKKGEYAEAIAMFETLKEGAILEVSERCTTAIVQLREAAKGSDASALAKQAEEAHKAFREGAAPKALLLFRARRYEEGLKEFDAAAADPGVAPLKDDLARERAAIVQAAAFWEAFLKTLRAKASQDVTIASTNPKEPRTVGKLARLGPDRAVIDTGDATAEVMFDKIHLDQVAAWSIGKTLPADDASTYVKAALFFWLDGHDDLARTYLATALEMGADITEPERVFREGLLRAASSKK
jgi:hypothetical protein